MADFSQNGKDDLAGIDDEIETQKKMLQQADDTLNQILEKMAADVHKLEDNNEFEPGEKYYTDYIYNTKKLYFIFLASQVAHLVAPLNY